MTPGPSVVEDVQPDSVARVRDRLSACDPRNPGAALISRPRGRGADRDRPDEIERLRLERQLWGLLAGEDRERWAHGRTGAARCSDVDVAAAERAARGLVNEMAEGSSCAAAEVEGALSLERPPGREQPGDLGARSPAGVLVVGQIVSVIPALPGLASSRGASCATIPIAYSVEALAKRRRSRRTAAAFRDLRTTGCSALADSGLAPKNGRASISTTGPRAYHSCFHPEPERWYSLIRGSM